MTLQKLALGVERKLLGQTLLISAVDGYGLHTNFGPEQGYAELSVEEWADQLVWPKMSGLHGVSDSGSGSGSSSGCERERAKKKASRADEGLCMAVHGRRR